MLVGHEWASKRNQCEMNGDRQQGSEQRRDTARSGQLHPLKSANTYTWQLPCVPCPPARALISLSWFFSRSRARSSIASSYEMLCIAHAYSTTYSLSEKHATCAGMCSCS